MQRTLLDRRQRIVVQNVSVHDVMAEYPWLASVDGLISEYKRVSECDIRTQIHNGLQEYGAAILILLSESKMKGLPDYVKKFMTTNGHSGSDEKLYATSAAAILGLVFLLKCDLHQLIGTTDPPDGSAVYAKVEAPMVFGSSVELFVEGNSFGRLTSFMKVFSAMVALFFIFNLAYPPSLTDVSVLGESSAEGARHSLRAQRYENGPNFHRTSEYGFK